MAEAKIPVDLLNPGQVFACLGFLEAANVLLGDAEGCFDWTDEANVCFRLRAKGVENAFGFVLDAIANAEVNWLSPSEAITERDGGKTIITDGMSWSQEPGPADLPAELIAKIDSQERRISFGYWADESGRFNTTFKKSTNGASSHVRFQNGLTALGLILKQHRDQAVMRPLDVPTRTESLFRLDPRSYADPLSAGFSADKLRKGNIDVRFEAYPICEIFAVIGLQHARPAKISSKSFRYCVWGFLTNAREGFLPTVLARAGLGEPVPFLPYRCFAVEHHEVKRGGDRKLISVKEETNL
jgi:CRISPR-associated protein Csb3